MPTISAICNLLQKYFFPRRHRPATLWENLIGLFVLVLFFLLLHILCNG